MEKQAAKTYLRGLAAVAFAFAAPLAADAAEVKDFFNGKDLTGWEATDMSYWSVRDGAIVGTAGEKPIQGNQFLWHKTTVRNFRLSLMVKQSPHEANAGIQFRSTPIKEGARGYQADVGEGYWGDLYHEHGRRMLARSPDTGEENIKREDWNHYEILAVGHRVWLAVNGRVTVALRDPFGELEGRIAVQIHGGAAQTVAYKGFKLIHDPKVELAGLGENELNRLLVDAPEQGARPTKKTNENEKNQKEAAGPASPRGGDSKSRSPQAVIPVKLLALPGF